MLQSDSVCPHRRHPIRLPHPWDSPGKNPGVGCHFLLQCMRVKSESEVAQSCPTCSDPMDCSPPGSSVHGVFQARVLEWGAIAFSGTYTLLLLLLSRFSHVRLCATPETAAHQAPRPWDSPGKNSGVSCHFLFQCMKVKSESEVIQLCPTCSDPMDCSPPGSSVHGIFQARVLEWGAIAFSHNIAENH